MNHTEPQTPTPSQPRIEGDPPIHWHEEIGSTNTEAMRLGEAGAPHGTAVVARYQTAGRGKLSAKWLMPPGEGILLSILLRRMPGGVPFGQLTLQMGYTIAEFLRARTGLTIDIKEPNDLMIGGRKLAGILSEARWRGDEMLHAVVGVGINVNVREFPEEIRERACSLAQAAGREFDVEELAKGLIEHIRSL